MFKSNFGKWRTILAVVLLLAGMNGCVYLIIGSVGALGGYVVSPDTVEGIITGHDMDKVWDAAIEIVSVMGVIEERNDTAGQLISKIQGSRVTITVMRMSQNTTKLTVKARKAFLPKIKISQDVYMKVIQYLNE